MSSSTTLAPIRPGTCSSITKVRDYDDIFDLNINVRAAFFMLAGGREAHD